jgi:cAMP phosphodiesterase
MPFYDDDTKAAFQARYGRPLHRFLANTDSPHDDIEAADFLRDRIWEYCAEVISYVRRFHPSAVFECLWPLDANQGKPAPDPAFRALNFHVNLPNE